MKKDKNTPVQSPEVDDVDRLFARLGSAGADGYRDFEPGRLPVRERAAALPEATPAAATGMTAAPVAGPAEHVAEAAPTSILTMIRPLRPEPTPPRQVAVAGPETPLASLFQRLLSAESQPAAAGPLRRMFSR